MQSTNYIPYIYGNMPIPGGGYVSGFAFHPTKKDLLYCRTDIGGAYRYDFATDSWISLVEHVTQEDLSETFPLAMALDAKHPERLYIACGIGGPEPRPNGYLAISNDYGETFVTKEIPCSVHGNNPGRGTGMRLVVDPTDSNSLFFASQTAGLLYTNDLGDSWNVLDVCSYTNPKPEKNLSFVFVAPNGSTIVVGASGYDNRLSEAACGHSLYVSYNKGTSFAPLWQPKVFAGDYTDILGYVGHRYDFDGRYLYITLNNRGRFSWIKWPGYSCDTGDSIGGRVLRFEFVNHQLVNPVDITPDFPQYGIYRDQLCCCGFGGVSSCQAAPGHVLLSTICRHAGDMIFESTDYGETWTVKLLNLEIGNLHFNSSYMRPEYNGGGSLIHWLSDVKYNPFDANMAVFNTGTGVFMSTNLQAPDWSFSDHCAGIEETVHLNVYAPTGGQTLVLDIVGDLGGFAFTEEGVACKNSFADEKGDRYITSINADYCDLQPDRCIATPRGNWTGKTQGGLVVSTDGAQTLQKPALPYGLSKELDESLDRICKPNNNSGWAALGADGQGIVWSVADGGSLPVTKVVYSKDFGGSFALVKVFDLDGQPVTDICFKPFSDRMDASYFYGVGPDSRLFVSKDGGATFYEKKRPANLPVQILCNIDAANMVEIRGVAGSFGTFYMAMNVDGLYVLTYDKEADAFSAEAVLTDGNTAYCVGLGICPGQPDYISSPKALYICGRINDVFGFYRSYDQGASWVKINNEKQHFGEIKSIDGDKRLPGRYFIATGTRGLKFGKEA